MTMTAETPPRPRLPRWRRRPTAAPEPEAVPHRRPAPPPRRLRGIAFVAVLFAGLSLLLAPSAAAGPECPDFILEPTIECPGVPPEPPPPPEEWMDTPPVPPAPPPPVPMPPPDPNPNPQPGVRCLVAVANTPYVVLPANRPAGNFVYTVDFCLDSVGQIVSAAARDPRLREPQPILDPQFGTLRQTGAEVFGDTIRPGEPARNSVSYVGELRFTYDPPGSAPLQAYRDVLRFRVGFGGVTSQSPPELERTI